MTSRYASLASTTLLRAEATRVRDSSRHKALIKALKALKALIKALKALLISSSSREVIRALVATDAVCEAVTSKEHCYYTTTPNQDDSTARAHDTGLHGDALHRLSARRQCSSSSSEKMRRDCYLLCID
jgi:hypothetical protein